MTSRNQGNFHCHCRIMSKSYDGAESFAHADIYVDETLEDPVVAASLLGLSTTVYFSNPANKMFRVNMTLRWSKDNGASWNGALTVWKGASGYSCLAIVPGMQANETFIGLVFEKGHLRYYESIVFVRFRLEWKYEWYRRTYWEGFFTISEIQIKIMKGAVLRNLSNIRIHHQTEWEKSNKETKKWWWW